MGRPQSFVSLLFVLLCCGGTVGCGGGTSGSTPSGDNRGQTIRVEVSDEDGAGVSGETVTVVGTEGSGRTDDEGVVNVEVASEESVTVQIDSAEGEVPLDLSTASEDAPFVAAVVQVDESGVELLAQAELDVRLQGECAPLFEQRDGIDFVLQTNIESPTPCTIEITQTRRGAPDPSVSGWQLALECPSNTGGQSVGVGAIAAFVDRSGTATLSWVISPEERGCDYVFIARLAAAADGVYPLGANFFPRVSLR